MLLFPSIFEGLVGLSVITIIALSMFVFPGAFAEPNQTWQIKILPGSSIEGTSQVFYPFELPVFLDDTVEWINEDSVAHHITSGLPMHPDYHGYFFEAGVVEAGESVSIKVESREFEAFYYLCKIHPWMTGKIFLSEAFTAQPETESPIITQKESYQKGDPITVTGQIHQDFWGTDYEILAYNQKNILVDVQYGKFNDDSTYSQTFSTNSELWGADGVYQFKLVYGLPSKVAQTQIQFNVKQSTNESIPVWIKDIGEFWCNNGIGDGEFFNAIEFLIQKEIIKTDEMSEAKDSNQFIPDWIKNTTCWWSDDKISDIDFLSGIEFLISKGTIRI